MNRVASSPIIGQGTAGADAETLALIATIKDARETRQEALKARSAARQDRIQLMQKAANKLRKIADKVRTSGLTSGLCGIGSAVLMAGAAGAGHAGRQASAQGFQAGAKAVEAIPALDRSSADAKRLEAQKADLQTEAENRQDQVEWASEVLAESKRIEQSLKQQLQKAGEARHAAAIAAARGS